MHNPVQPSRQSSPAPFMSTECAARTEGAVDKATKAFGALGIIVLCRVRGLSRNHLRIGVSRFNREPDASVGKDSGHGFDCSSRVIPSLENVSTQSPGD